MVISCYERDDRYREKLIECKAGYAKHYFVRQTENSELCEVGCLHNVGGGKSSITSVLVKIASTSISIDDEALLNHLPCRRTANRVLEMSFYAMFNYYSILLGDQLQEQLERKILCCLKLDLR